MTSVKLIVGIRLVALSMAGLQSAPTLAQTPLADSPVLATVPVPPNVMMTLSVEWPTGTVAAYNDNASSVADNQCSGRDGSYGVCYFANRTYLGYFDAGKCYSYQTGALVGQDYFVPVSLTATRNCSASSGRWSGNYLNWATMHAIDGFRFAMTGGDRFIDTTTNTVVEKARHSGQGGHGQFPIKRVRNTNFVGGGVTVPAVTPSTVAPVDASWTNAYARVNAGDGPLAIGTSRNGVVFQLANNPNFLQSFSTRTYRFVKVQLSSANAALALAEVRVLDSFNTNVSNGRTATQSSVQSGRTASRAVDNNTNGVLTNNSIAQTNTSSQPWWQVDLAALRNLSSIQVWNRTDASTGVLADFYVFAASTDISNRTIEDLLRDPAVWKYQQTAPPAPTLTLTPASTDRAFDYMSARVQVCNASVGLESNCLAYGSSNKPVGIVQENADAMRFGVMAYLNVDGTATRGGVLRSPLKYVGPETIVPNGTPQTNTRREINTDGTHVADPEGQVVSGDIVSSGVINYLNKFGKSGPKSSLKSNDTVSEMFYESLRYVRGFAAPTPEFINFAGADTAAARDGFSSNRTWPANSVSNIDGRPIQYACQKTYFVGIGDTNAWCDSWGPGNTLPASACGTVHDGGPADPGGINVTTLGNQIGTAEGLGSLGTTWANSGRGNTYHIASYAFWANVNDILVDDASKPWTVGRQNAQTYWVDVRETGSFNGTVVPKNQYWLAGKYGGFDTQGGSRTGPGDFNPENQTYFTGERPDKLIESLRKVFDDIRDSVGTSAASALTSTDLTTAGGSFTTEYDSGNWTGDLLGREVGFNADGQFTTSDPRWSASDRLEALAAGTGWRTTRKVVSFNPDSRRGVRFEHTTSPGANTLTAVQLNYLGGTTVEQQDQINYIRGDRSNETGTNPKYRPREALLGDMVNAQPVFVGAPDEELSDEFNPGYADFVASREIRTRTPVVYAAANDGMLHAFNADMTAGTTIGGQELFAYVPSFALSGPSSPATPLVDGLAGRSSPLYRHRFLVDATPAVSSVDFNRTSSTSGSPDWRTILVGGLGHGGKGFYALDITAPREWTSESAVGGKVLWEFSHPDLGYSFGKPVITKTAKYGWVVIVTSGYNNTTGATEENRGRGFLFVLNARTGQLLQQIGTAESAGSETNPSGLTHAVGSIFDQGDSTSDSVYAGDLLGNLWRFDLRGNPTRYPAGLLMAELEDPSGNPQPVTTKPRIAAYPDSIERWVFVGTGRLLDASDRQNTQVQTFYAFRDGVEGRVIQPETLPAGVSFPISRDDLVAASYDDLTASDPSTKYDDSAPMGWYLDLSGANDNGATERIIFDPAPADGVVAFSTNYPSEDVCSPGVTSRLYALDFRTAASLQLDLSGEIIGFYESALSILQAQRSVNRGGSGGGWRSVIVTQSGGGIGGNNGEIRLAGAGAPVPVRLNWREVLE